MGWNWAVRLSERFETWVLTDAVFAEQCREHLETRRDGAPGLHLVGVPRPAGGPGRFHPLWNHLWLHYATQYLWQRRALAVARALHARERFAIVHQLNMIGYREPGFLWSLDAATPFVWGPIGGYVQVPAAFLPSIGLHDRALGLLRNALNAWQMEHLVRVRRAMRRADVLFAATRVDAAAIRRIHEREAFPLAETGTSAVLDQIPPGKHVDPARPLQLVWVGVFVGTKALPLALRALALVRRRVSRVAVRLTIVGDGPRRAAWRRLAITLGVDDLCAWLGWLPHAEALDRIRAADALLFTSIKEATSTVVPEALMCGVPVICHDACGFGDAVTERSGCKIPMLDPETSVAGFAQAILALARDRGRLAALSRGALARARELTWSKTVAVALEHYEELLSRRERGGGMKLA